MSNVDVFEVIKSRHRRNKDLQQRRIREVEERNPRYTELINERNDLLSEAAILRLTHETEAAERLERKAARLDKEERKILEDLSLPDNYLDDIYDCPICQDRGYLDNNEPCSCLLKIIRQSKYHSFDLTESFKDCTFDNFNLNLFSKEEDPEYGIAPYDVVLNYLEFGKKFCRDFRLESPSLFIFGKVGVGKTYFVSCIVNELIKKDIDIIYISAPNLLNYLYEDISSHHSLEESHKNEFKNVELLVIDDLGSENMNNFSLSALSEIIDYRVLNKKSTIITSNLSPDFILKNQIYPERMASRIMAFYEPLPYIGRNLRTPI